MALRVLQGVTKDNATAVYRARLCNHCLPCNMLITNHLRETWTRWQKWGKELVTAINSCLCLQTGDSWRQVCTNCVVVTGPPNASLCFWITLAEPSNLPSLTKIKFTAAITKLEKNGELQWWSLAAVWEYWHNKEEVGCLQEGQAEYIDVCASNSHFIGIKHLTWENLSNYIFDKLFSCQGFDVTHSTLLAKDV